MKVRPSVRGTRGDRRRRRGRRTGWGSPACISKPQKRLQEILELMSFATVFLTARTIVTSPLSFSPTLSCKHLPCLARTPNVALDGVGVAEDDCSCPALWRRGMNLNHRVSPLERRSLEAQAAVLQPSHALSFGARAAPVLFLCRACACFCARADCGGRVLCTYTCIVEIC